METEALTIPRSALIDFLWSEYGLEVVALTFVPKGMDSFSYRAETAGGAWYFVKLHDPRRAANAFDLERALQVVHQLRSVCRLPFVVALRPTRQGRVMAFLEDYPVAVFEWLDGPMTYPAPLTATERAEVARMLAELHQSCSCVGSPAPMAASFELGFRPQLLAVLEWAAQSGTGVEPDLQEVCARLNRERDDILATMERIERLGRWVQAEHEPVVVHSEPSPWNLLRGPAGGFYLVDWGEVALGPAERDLLSFTGADFETLLTHYADARTAPPRLCAEAFEFYIYRWGLSEIAEWGVRLLIEGIDPAERSLALDDLANYLPIQHTHIREGVQKIEAVLQRVL